MNIAGQRTIYWHHQVYGHFGRALYGIEDCVMFILVLVLSRPTGPSKSTSCCSPQATSPQLTTFADDKMMFCTIAMKSKFPFVAPYMQTRCYAHTFVPVITRYLTIPPNLSLKPPGRWYLRPPKVVSKCHRNPSTDTLIPYGVNS